MANSSDHQNPAYSLDCEELKIAISQDFFMAFSKLPKPAQKKTMEFVSKFQQNPRSTGINYEKINDARDAAYRSTRVNQNYRAIIRKPDNGNTFLLLWVDNHDAAYDWARRHKFQINPTTGAIQIFEPEDGTALEPQPTPAATQAPAAAAPAEEPTPATPLFNLHDESLLSLGVPEPLLERVRSLSSEHMLERMEKQLPVEVFEALYLIAAGTSWADIERDYIHKPSEPVDPTDIDAALSRPESQRFFHVVEDELELTEMLEAPLEHWRVFLHPSQRKLVNRNWNGPVRLLGGAGTGKTVVAMHRARWLAKNALPAESNAKVLFTTFTANLALDIETNLRKICTAEEMQRIEVKHVDRWVSDFLRRHEYPHEIVYADRDSKYQQIWNQALTLVDPSLEQPDSFYKEEWERVVLPQRVHSKVDYFKATRTGRGVALNRKQRALIWPVFEELRSQLHQQGLRTFEDATLDTTELLKQHPQHALYRSVVIDETQDMGPEALALLRQLVAEDSNDIFAVGDGHQRIYRRKAVMSHCGIKIVGRSHKLRINYRTTEEIRRFAVAVLENAVVDDLDGESDTSNDYRSLMHGENPVVAVHTTPNEEAVYIADEVQKLIDEGTRTQDICIATRTKHFFEDIEPQLVNRGSQTHIVSASKDNRNSPGVRFATMHRIKGLEFRYMFIASVNAGVVPLKLATEGTEDPVEKRSRDLNERALLHVAATRAIKGLYISTSGFKSPYLIH